MSHYITVPINESGIVYDVIMDTVIQEAMAPAPLDFRDVFVYSHGWSTDAIRSMDMYGRFSVELSRAVHSLVAADPSGFSRPPQNTFGVGIHWPSEITEDPNSPLNDFQVMTFYSMEHRADIVGANGAYAILRLMLGARPAPAQPLRINLIGHSFGCKVVCAALQGLANDARQGHSRVSEGTTFNIVLLQGAMDNDDLEAAGNYGGVAELPTRILITYSSEDEACARWYPLASKVANLFRSEKTALGARGPTDATASRFGTVNSFPVDQGDKVLPKLQPADHLVCADLSQLHTKNTAYQGGISGHHSDINLPEIYELVTGFLFK